MPLATLTRRTIDTLIPPRCIACNAMIEEQGKLCLACWSSLSFITAPQCATCGFPFEVDLGEGAICGACAADAPPFAMARASFRYNDASRRMVTGFKFADRTYKAPAFAELLWRAGRPFWEKADLIVPVPLHRRRLMQRRYNQAALLCQGLATRVQVPVALEAMERVRHTTPQTGLDRNARHVNVRGAFRVRAAYRETVRGKRIVLVDDVMTTGATIRACSKALMKQGARAVYVLTLARSVGKE